jgi:KaiC/GvpD/RAD55 family RecA-like ATPase
MEILANHNIFKGGRTMVTTLRRFDSIADRLPPENLEAEDSLLGGLLIDATAIFRVWETLKPEHFYSEAHRIIYQACIKLAKKNQPVDMIHVASYLADHGNLERVGGRNKLAQLYSCTVNAINVDSLASLIIKHAVRRQLIEYANHCLHLGYSSEYELDEVRTIVKEKSNDIVELLTAKSEEDLEMWHYNKMIQSIRDIELKCLDPGLRTWKIQNLAKQYGRSAKDIEGVYFKSLIHAENEPLMSLQKIMELYGNEIRQWLIHGFLPMGTTVLLHAKGGVGKTRLSYDFFYHLATGTSWQGFPVTKKNKCLIIQTDESPNDMLSALEDRGITTDMDIRYKTRWQVDHIQHLRREIEEFRPDVVLIDSLTSVSRHSSFTENDTEYARPVLLLRDIAQEFGCTILIIHHSNSEGESRGTKAIFNSVSEVWALKRCDNTADGLDRILEIQKSRSRAPAKYKLRFDPENKSWDCLGKEGDEPGSPNATIRDSIVGFLFEHLGTAFEVEEIAHSVGASIDTIRRTAFDLSQEGVITRLRAKALGRGYRSRYIVGTAVSSTSDHLRSPYLITSFPTTTVNTDESDQSDQGVPFVSDHFFSSVAASVTDESDPIPPKNPVKNFSKKSENLQNVDHLSPKDLLDIEKKVITGSDHISDQGSDSPGGVTPRSLIEADRLSHSVTIPETIPEPVNVEEDSSKKTHITKDDSPLIEVELEGVYWSRSLNKKVKVKKLYTSVQKADVHVAGDAISKPRLPLSDLCSLSSEFEPWKPVITKSAMYGFELVKVVGFDPSKRQYQVEFKSGRTLYVKASKLSQPDP